MRLINADKLRYRHKVKCNSDTTRPYTLNCISFDEVQSAKTIKAVPIDVLDDIKSEIKFITDTNGVKHIHRDDVFKIIDRHMEGVIK